tara:strand:+ start:1733 stop:2425 length:693 start_codon:yes stop_codon:yes gene_type:complete
MEDLKFTRDMAQLAVLQRIELADKFLMKVRKLFGRYLFSKLFSKYLINKRKISQNYLKVINNEYQNIEKFLNDGQKILSIGGGIGGLELLILKKFPNTKIDLIEKNYISEKVKYGWDYKNNEAYNNLTITKKFLNLNGIDTNKYSIYDIDKKNLPIKSYDLIISLYSLDYHYDFNIYVKYLRSVSNKNTKIIFDTIRPDFFFNIFEKISVIKENESTVHKSKRIKCTVFK